MTPLGGARRSSWAPPPPDGTGRPMATVSPQLRASRDDRQRCADYLTAAYAVEQLDNDELSARLDAALKATTLGDLDALTADLNVDTMQALVPAETKRKALAAARQRARKRGRPATVVVAVVAAVALVVTGGILVFNRTTADAPPAPAGQPAGQAPEGNGGVPPPAAVGNLTTINWSATFGDAGDNWFAGVALAPDGARIAVGYTSDAPAADGDMYGVHRNAAIAAYAADGSLWWSKTLGGRGHDEFTDVAVRSDGTIVAVGYTDSTDGDFTQNGNVLTSSGVVAAFSPEGTVLWSRTLGPGENYVTAVAFTDDGSIVVAGGFNAFLVKLSPTGTPVWDRTYSGSGQSAFNGLALAPNGDIVVAGSTQSADGDFPAKNVSADPNIRDALVARLDADGNPLWRQVQGGSGGDEFSAVAIGPDGTVVAAGFGFGRDGDFTPGTGPGDYFCAALSSFAPDGTPLWAHGFGGPGMSGFWSVVIWPDGRIIAGGNTNISSGDFAIRHDSSDEALLARVSADGRLQDYGTWGGSVAVSDLKDLVFVPSGEIVAVGYTSATDGDFPAAQSAYAALVVDFASLP